MRAARGAATRWRARRAPGRRVSPRPASAAWVLRARRLAGRPRRGSGRLGAARRLARPARPYFYPPPSTPARPGPARRDSGSSRALALSPQRHSPRDQAGCSDRRWPSGRGGVSPPPPLGPEVSPGIPVRQWAVRGGGLLPGPSGFRVRRLCARDKRRASDRRRPGRGRGGQGRGSRGFCSVTADASPSLRDQPDR